MGVVDLSRLYFNDDVQHCSVLTFIRIYDYKVSDFYFAAKIGYFIWGKYMHVFQKKACVVLAEI